MLGRLYEVLKIDASGLVDFEIEIFYYSSGKQNDCQTARYVLFVLLFCQMLLTFYTFGGIFDCLPYIPNWLLVLQMY